MKARRAIFVLLLLAAALFVARAPAATTAPTTAPTAAPTTAPSLVPTTAPTAAPTSALTTTPTTAAGGKVFKVAVVLPSAINDLAFSQSMRDSLVRVQKEMGQDKFQFAYSDNMFNVPDAAAAIRDYASKGYDLVIAHGSQYGTSLADIAPDFPKTAFAWGTAVDTFESKGVKNVFSYTVLSDQGGYVEGVMAAMLTKSSVIGVIGPIAAGDGKLTVDGFVAGIKATKPSVKTQVVYTGSFSDVALASQAAQTQISSGADVLTGTGQMVVGAISVAKDKNVLWFGNQSSQTSLAPKIVVANQVYDWSGVLKSIIDNVNKGVMGRQVYTIDLKNGIKIEYNPDFALPADVKAAAEKTIQGLKDGTIKTGVH